MAEGGTDRLTLLNWPTLLAFVLLSWGIVLLPPPMKSLRPTGEPAPATTRAASRSALRVPSLAGSVRRFAGGSGKSGVKRSPTSEESLQGVARRPQMQR